MDPKGESTTVTLHSEHSIKFIDPCISHLSLKRSYLQSTLMNIVTKDWPRDCQLLSPKGNIYTGLLPKIQGSFWKMEEGQKELFKAWKEMLFSGPSRGATHIASEQLQEHIPNPVQTQARQTPGWSMERRVGHTTPPQVVGYWQLLASGRERHTFL